MMISGQTEATNADERRPAADEPGVTIWRAGGVVAALLAIDPEGLGGAVLRTPSGPIRDQWIDQFRALLPQSTPFRKLPANIDDERLLGGIDLAQAMQSGRLKPVKGVLASAHGGVIIASMAERLSPATASILGAALDEGVVHIERQGVSRTDPAQFACLLQDEGADPSEAAPSGLVERVAFYLNLAPVGLRDAKPWHVTSADIDSARAALETIHCSEEILASINMAALSSGVPSIRMVLFCVRAARAHAAMLGHENVTEEDAGWATAMVLGPRARAHHDQPDHPPPPNSPDQSTDAQDAENNDLNETDALTEQLIEAIKSAAISASFSTAHACRSRGPVRINSGKAGAPVESGLKGRPLTSRGGDWRRGRRIDMAATLRASALWRPLREKEAVRTETAVRLIRPEDLQFRRFRGRRETVVIFAVDASGSAAMHRMAEAKGAIERLLAECYTRRDYVALIAFRGEGAELLLPATRALARARRALSALPGGGATPLAAGLAAALTLAGKERGMGRTPYIVILSDGRANIALDGAPGRPAAEADAERVARQFRAMEGGVLFFDIASRPSRRAQQISAAMNARYTPLPFADSGVISRIIRQEIETQS